MPITAINIGSAPNDGTGDTIRDSFDICNDNFLDLDTTKYDIPTGTITQYVRGDGTLATLPTLGTSDKLITEVSNQTGGTLLKGTIVYINGSHGNLPTITPSQANNDTNSAQTLGFVQDDIANNATGFVVVAGKIGNLDTSALTAGVQLYLSPSTAGAYTITKQFAPNHLVYVGVCVRSHPTLGTIEVKIQNGYELDELHDVSAQTPANRDLLGYNSTTQLWENESFYERIRGGVQYFTDFDSSFNVPNFQQVNSGGSCLRVVAAIPGSTSNMIGIASYQTGTSIVGYAMHISEQNAQGQQFHFGGGTWVYEVYVSVETLSDATNRFRFITGFGDVAAGGSENNGAFFTYDEGGTTNGTAASANWQCVNVNNTARQLTTTSVPVTTNWVKLRIVVNSSATAITYFINGTLVATHTTAVNIPTFAAGRRFKVKQGIFKSVGTTNRNVHCDYLFYENNLTTLR